MKAKAYNSEEQEWLNLTPRQRLLESAKLWRFYLQMGGSLDPEPDPKSPFYIPEVWRKSLLIGGQACIVYGAAEFSRDTDFVVLCEAGNLARLRRAL